MVYFSRKLGLESSGDLLEVRATHLLSARLKAFSSCRQIKLDLIHSNPCNNHFHRLHVQELLFGSLKNAPELHLLNSTLHALKRPQDSWFLRLCSSFCTTL